MLSCPIVGSWTPPFSSVVIVSYFQLCLLTSDAWIYLFFLLNGQIIIKMAAANGVRCISVGQNGLLSTPTVSPVIRERVGIDVSFIAWMDTSVLSLHLKNLCG